jgi:hypothetical protein
MESLLICGDSFAADWTVKYSGSVGWPNMLCQDYQVTNLAQAGCGEYKIYLQLKSTDLDAYDKIVVCHTSPYRIFIKHHPVHANDILHAHSDLLYSDIKAHSITNKNLLPIVDYFEKYFDLDHAVFTHGLICKEIDQMLSGCNVIHVANIEWQNLYKFPNMLYFDKLRDKHAGTINHYDSAGNRQIYQLIKDKLSTLL